MRSGVGGKVRAQGTEFLYGSEFLGNAAGPPAAAGVLPRLEEPLSRQGGVGSAVAAVDYTELHDSGTRRLRVVCKLCSVSIEIARMREHLRSSHHLDSTAVETSYLAALMDVRRARRGRT